MFIQPVRRTKVWRQFVCNFRGKLLRCHSICILRVVCRRQNNTRHLMERRKKQQMNKSFERFIEHLRMSTITKIGKVE